MFFNLVFESSGDCIPFKSCNDKFLEYYVEWLDYYNFNKFHALSNPANKLKSLLQSLHENLLCYEYFNLEKLCNYKLETLELEQYLDQKVLNDYHAHWVNAQACIVDIMSIRSKDNKDVIEKKICDVYSDDIITQKFASIIHRLGLWNIYEDINEKIHKIEKSFSRREECSNGSRTFIDNIFDKTILSYSEANLQVAGHHKGRTLYNKFIMFDENFEADDENTFNQINNCVTFSLRKFETVTPSKEYVDWCNKNNKEPIGEHLNLGNVIDLSENLLKYRQIMYKNFNQNFSLILN